MIRLIVFDFDGTLGDTRRNIVMTLQQTMQQLRLPVATAADCTATIGLTLQDSFRRLVAGLSDEMAETCADTYRRIFEQNKQRLRPTAFPQVRETMEWLVARRLTLSVASSRTSSSLRDLLASMGLAPYVTHVVGADDVPQPKPSPAPVLATLHALTISPAETIVVGDMPVDIAMGRNAGCAATCGVTWGNSTRDELLQAGASMVIDRMEQLKQCPLLG